MPVVLPFPTQPPHSSGAPHRQSGQKPIFVVFEVVGGLIGSILLIGLLRCCYQYNKAPKRDRITEVLNRHHLQRELAELEQNSHILRRPPLGPAPPYFPAPPPYKIIASTPISANAHPTSYTDLDTDILPSPQSSDLIPPRPAG